MAGHADRRDKNAAVNEQSHHIDRKTVGAGGDDSHRANPCDPATLCVVASSGGRNPGNICLDHKIDNRRRTSNIRLCGNHHRQRIRSGCRPIGGRLLRLESS
ncbi:hypothetical protein AGR4A_Cc30355 [Agrobacterium tumefaciens str. B6]|uniref:Uncharacterized protein n=1 Tax=Agrobacterium tumefaciens str. B6 TaxID=1183423 RepID=A0A822UXJ9_AGRTU|nr:hypothetical protein AGR4A_Cc30355 [Agrobacterium tumefaciens str. B6]